jgi:hypothetical protein
MRKPGAMPGFCVLFSTSIVAIRPKLKCQLWKIIYMRGMSGLRRDVPFEGLDSIFHVGDERQEQMRSGQAAHAFARDDGNMCLCVWSNGGTRKRGALPAVLPITR